MQQMHMKRRVQEHRKIYEYMCTIVCLFVFVSACERLQSLKAAAVPVLTTKINNKLEWQQENLLKNSVRKSDGSASDNNNRNYNNNNTIITSDSIPFDKMLFRSLHLFPLTTSGN